MRKRERARNFRHNGAISPPGGPIVLQKGTAPYRYGSRTSDYNGCSWIALYNLLHQLGDPVEPAEIIDWMERRPPLSGLWLRGLLGAYPWAVKAYLRHRGYRVKTTFRQKRAAELAAEGLGGIALLVRKNGAHYVAFVPGGGSRPGEGEAIFHFYNERQGEERDIRSFSGFWRESRALLGMTMVVMGERKGLL